jgi:hypothetical protein
MRLSEQDIGDVYYTTLLQHVGCAAYAHETGRLFGGDDIALRATGTAVSLAARVDCVAPIAPTATLLELRGGHACQIERIDRFLDASEGHLAGNPV